MQKKQQNAPQSEVQQPIKISRSQFKAQHQEANKQLWKAAEEPERFHYLEAKNDVPLKTDFKPTVKVLSRKPTPQIASRNDPSSQMAGLTLEGDDSEEEERKRSEVVFAERQKKAAYEREEKQRKYAEVRERLFGSQKPTSRDSSSDNRNPSNRGGLLSTDSRGPSRKGRSRNNRDSQPSSSTDQSPARVMIQPRQLFDPTYDAKPKSQGPGPVLPKEEQPIRMPRGPDGSGRGGFGFAPRGGKSNA